MKMKDRIGFLVALIIIAGISLSSVFIYFAYTRVISDNSESIAELSATNIYSEINSELTKPIYVSLTMANDSFVKNWLSTEESASSQDIIDYLLGIHDKYDYSSVFLISNNSLDYYRYSGLHKTISPTDEHDVWYYTFINSESSYDLDVDLDEANSTLTIFVNAKIYDDDDNILGVVGVGVEMNYIQEMISSFEINYDLEAFLINPEGLIQSHSNTEYIESRNIFDESMYQAHESEILDSFDSMRITSDHTSSIISRYVDELDWYIVVVKDSNVLLGFFRDYFASSFIALSFVVIIVSSMINKLVESHKKRVYELALTDHLTLLKNRRGFDLEFHHLSENNNSESIVFMADIDNFKAINDQYGHSYGDDILIHISSLIKTNLKNQDVLSRWGGDEFAGIIFGDINSSIATLEAIQKGINETELLKEKGVSISIGFTIYNKGDSIDKVIQKIDKAMYQSKERGGNQISQD
ncbi:MAG: sensor domain-containing diguanylate cyclase [Firmicutes bacterium]|nr:sensor domain-containing diguanylate cyclase [Bacillota bacterium]